MTDDTRSAFVMDALESRTLLSAGHGGFEHLPHVPTPVSAAVQADLDKIKVDQQKLSADTKSLKPTLQADQKAVSDAVKALDATLKPLRDTLKADTKTWADVLKADRKAIQTDRNDATKLAADKAKQTADLASAKTALKADAAAIQTVIDNDPAVKAAKAKLVADSKPITDDQAALKADREQLKKDILAQKSGATP